MISGRTRKCDEWEMLLMVTTASLSTVNCGRAEVRPVWKVFYIGDGGESEGLSRAHTFTVNVF